jgi:hypothetical protein
LLQAMPASNQPGCTDVIDALIEVLSADS